MYQIIVTEDFMNVIKDLPLKYIAVLTDSFLSIKKIEDEDIKLQENCFITNLMEHLKTKM